jgi:hypothetical protein
VVRKIKQLHGEISKDLPPPDDRTTVEQLLHRWRRARARGASVTMSRVGAQVALAGEARRAARWHDGPLAPAR